MPKFFDLLQQLLRDFFFGLGDWAPDLESRIGVGRRPAPVRAALFFRNPFPLVADVSPQSIELLATHLNI
jgi:hypothetical protein